MHHDKDGMKRLYDNDTRIYNAAKNALRMLQRMCYECCKECVTNAAKNVLRMLQKNALRMLQKNALRMLQRMRCKMLLSGARRRQIALRKPAILQNSCCPECLNGGAAQIRGSLAPFQHHFSRGKLSVLYGVRWLERPLIRVILW